MSKEIKEDFGVGPGSVMTTQSGIAGLPPDIPPVNKSPNIVRRSPPKFKKREPHSRMGGKAVFRVDPKTYYECYLGKLKGQHYETLLKGSEVYEEIRDYGRLNWREPIIVQNEVTGAMVYLKYGSEPIKENKLKGLAAPKANFPDKMIFKVDPETGQKVPHKYLDNVPTLTNRASKETWSLNKDVRSSENRAAVKATKSAKTFKALKNYLSNRPPRG